MSMYTTLIRVSVCTAVCLMVVAFTNAAVAKSDIGFKGIGPRIGYVDPEGGLDGTIEFGAAMEFGEFVRQLHWDGSVSFWSAGRDYNYYNGSGYRNYSWSLRDFILRSGINYHFLEGEWEPYVGGGLGLHFIRNLMDEVHFTSDRRHGNQLTMVKKLNAK